MRTFSKMLRGPQFWLPLSIPLLFGALSVAIDALITGKAKNSVGIYMMKLLTNICFACLAIDLWALTISVSMVLPTDAYRHRQNSLLFLTITFLVAHILLYTLCLIAMNEYRSLNSKGRLWGLPSPAWAAVLVFAGVTLTLVERIKVLRLFHVWR